MTCSTTSSLEYAEKRLARCRTRAARINNIHARHLTEEILQSRRKKRPNKAQRLLKEAKAMHKTLREVARLIAEVT